MPRGDGTGPMGAGPGTGRGIGGGGGMGRGLMRGLMGGLRGGFGLGAGGNCVCPRCGKTVPHQRGVPCTQMKCPGCGAAMTRAR